MTPVGHVAFAYLAAAPRTIDVRAPLFVVAGALLPDVVDKSLWLLGVFPWGRTVGHAAIVWAGILALVYLWDLSARPIPWARWLAWGGVSHLVCDLVDDFSAGFESSAYAFSAWFGFPLTNPDMWPWIVRPGFPPTRPVSALELGCYGLVGVYLWSRRRRSFSLAW